MSDDVHAVEVGGATVRAVVGDLTELDVHAIVNAANRQLRHGGGVAAAIARAGGPVIQEESDAWVADHGPLDRDEAAVTSGGELPTELVIHVAGPVYDEGRDDNESHLRAAVRAALEAADAHEVPSIAFPAISAGVYGYPQDEATAVIADEVATHLAAGGSSLTDVRLVGLDETAATDFADGLRAAT